MKRIELNAVTMVHRHAWNVWPDVDHQERLEGYGAISELRWQERFERDDIELVVNHRYYPAYTAFAWLREKLPIKFPIINNTVLPSAAVIKTQIMDLTQLAGECQVFISDHGWQCFPATIQAARQLFPLTILMHADDCPESSPVKTFPIAPYFDALYHQMYVYDFQTGALVADEYRKLQPDIYCRFRTSQESAGLSATLLDCGFSIERKIEELRSQSTKYGLVFVGAITRNRAQLIEELAKRLPELSRIKPARLHGKSPGMPHGPLLPLDYGKTLGPLYAEAAMTFNVPVSSIWNCRTIDAMQSGTVHIAHDPHGELSSQGLQPYVHFVPFDGSAQHLAQVANEWLTRPTHCAEMVAHAHRWLTAYLQKNSWSECFADIYFRFLGRFDNEAPARLR